MGNSSNMTENEKTLLTTLGRFPNISMNELTSRTQYKRVSSVIRSMRKFKEQDILYGPFYLLNYDKLCKNPLHKLYCIMKYDQSYETVISYLRIIDSFTWIYPVLSIHKDLVNMVFLSSDNAEMRSIFQLLKNHGIITDFIIRVLSRKLVTENPNFFGEYNPSLDNLLDPCNLSDLSLGCHDTDWNGCDISILPYLMKGYKGSKLIEILRGEKKVNRTWTYSQIKYSREKMVENGLIEKVYIINPFKSILCADFLLFLKTDDKDLTQRIISNCARGERIYREYGLFGDWGYIGFTSHSQFLMGLMSKLDKIDEIKEKELYQLRSHPIRRFTFDQFPEERYYDIYQPPILHYFDVDHQELQYPYSAYKEQIKEKLDNEI